MDAAYDRIQEEVTSPSTGGEKEDNKQDSTLTSELQEAYKAFSTSSWGASLGGFLGSVRSRGESIVQGARQEFLGEYNAASSQAAAGYDELQTQLENATEKVTLNTPSPSKDSFNKDSPADGPSLEKPEDLGADIVKEAESMLSRFRTEASKRLKDIEKAEDAADEALLKFGTNIRNFLRDAVSITAPEDGASGDGKSQVLFESRDSEGRRVIHTTRFDAQLHVIHSSLDSFLKDPSSPEYEKWAKDFDVEKKTDQIARDLEKYEELRRAMEKLVPEKVEYADFWKRYYFLRHVIETEEAKRREMLRGAATGDDEEVAWDEDSDEETSTPNAQKNNLTSASQTTLQAAPLGKVEGDNTDMLKPVEGRRSNDEKSQADSDASYDIVSGATSRASGSPKEKKAEPVKEESDEEDWE
ncbi:BSD-domain-containing protein [Viridothelium virens]|uniref:BSD-domain-containing protein n=1 Tax=Viridothelium virens TaxID=1048519 RepID=A0A6A6HNL4_VIRVR|nr:BSD-domain-containing protein [Viridothelium virens]